VIIIVGILIAALLPRLTGSQSRARDTARIAAVNQIASAGALAVADRVAVTADSVDGVTNT
jgi:type II secretory pathway pseudopilin PulG